MSRWPTAHDPTVPSDAALDGEPAGADAVGGWRGWALRPAASASSMIVRIWAS